MKAPTTENSFVLPDEVLKSRRNLIIISFITLIVLYVSPAITKIAITGIEVELRHNNKIKYVLIFLLIFEAFAFHIRYRISRNLLKLTELESKLNNIKVDTSGDIEKPTTVLEFIETGFQYDPMSCNESSWKVFNESENRHFVLNSLILTNTHASEYILPLVLAAFTLLWSLYEVLPIFPYHLLP
jgi:hypothetical protein